MPVEAKPLFRPDVIRSHLAAFSLPERVETLRRQLADWPSLLATGRANNFKEQELLPDFLTLYFHGVLGEFNATPRKSKAKCNGLSRIDSNEDGPVSRPTN